MRKNIVAGNWKMNKTFEEGLELARAVDLGVANNDMQDVTVIVAPPFIHLSEVTKNVKNIGVSAQNCAAEVSGAYTGEVSATMVKSTGAEYTIIGHSERRSYYNETDGILNKKVKLALENGLKPIFCCGEILAEREANNHFQVVKDQLDKGVFDLSETEFKNIIIAYEPVWAIGTGVTATPEQAQEMHKYIRGLIVERYGEQIADDTTILYGGSCNAQNAKDLFSNPDVDGGLIGGASLKPDDFLTIAQSF